jgi:hypothetical protein
MLPERFRELLTAYVDGEISARQRRQVLRLLRRSREARALLRRLEQDSRELKALPAPVLQTDLSDSVLEAIARGQPAPTRPRPPAPRAFPAWTGFAAAAAVLLAVGFGSFLYFSPKRGASGGNPEAAKQGDKDRPDPPKRQLAKDRTPPPDERLPAPEEEVPDTPRPIVKRVPGDEDPPPPEKLPAPPPGDVLGDRRRDRIELEQVDVALPSITWMLDLKKGRARADLLKQLGKGTAFHVELPCKDGTRAFERLRDVLTQRNIKLVLDPLAQVRLKNPWKTDYAVFLEGLTPTDLVDLLHHLGELDRFTHDRGRRGVRRFVEMRLDGHVVVAPLSRQDRKAWAEMLGVDPTRPLPKRTGALRPDPRTPLPDVTEGQVVASLDGKGVPRPGASPRAPEPRSALVLSYSPRSRPSAEVKGFLEARKPLPRRTLQVFLILRGVG